MLVVIPYYGASAQGHELELAISGWRKYCQTEYHIVVVGGSFPDIGGEDITFVPLSRVEEQDGCYLPHLDMVNKFRKVYELYPSEEGFVWAVDDNYPIKPFDEKWIKELRYLTDDKMGVPQAGGWDLDKYFTKCKLEEEHLPTRNWTTHLPCWFDFKQLMSRIKELDMSHNSYVIEDVYFNKYYPEAPAKKSADYNFFLTKEDDYKRLKVAMQHKMWICNTPSGWSIEMEQILREYYNL